MTVDPPLRTARMVVPCQLGKLDMGRDVAVRGVRVKPRSRMSFSDDEVERYARHLVLREIGGPGQQRLKAARVLIVGAGGLGAPAALYLTAAGVGEIALVDPDVVSLSNLQRQVLYATADDGRVKVEAAAERLTALNPNVRLTPMAERLTSANARALVAGFD